MKFLRRRALRTMLTVLLTLAIGFTLAEEVVADVHDGGATHAELDRVTGISHADETADHPDSVHPDPDSSPIDSDHPAHVCHCTHAHGGVVMLIQMEPAPLRAPRTSVFPATASLDLGSTAPPATRPPIT